MKNTTNDSTTFGTLEDLLASCRHHILPNCIRIYADTIAQHNIDVATVSALLPSQLSCDMSKVTPADIVSAKVRAELAGTDYVEPQPYLFICKSVDKRKATNAKIAELMGKSDDAQQS